MEKVRERIKSEREREKVVTLTGQYCVLFTEKSIQTHCCGKNVNARM